MPALPRNDHPPWRNKRPRRLNSGRAHELAVGALRQPIATGALVSAASRAVPTWLGERARVSDRVGLRSNREVPQNVRTLAPARLSPTAG